MILPYLYFLNLAWGGTYKSNPQRLVILQKRALRITNKSTYDANTGPIFRKLKLLKFHEIHSFQLGFLCFLLRTLHSFLSSITFSSWTAKSMIIILGMPILFASHYAEQTPDSFQFISKIQSFTILWILISGSSSPASFKRKLKEHVLAFSMAIIRLIN